jgi:hypothetical protein
MNLVRIETRDGVYVVDDRDNLVSVRVSTTKYRNPMTLMNEREMELVREAR